MASVQYRMEHPTPQFWRENWVNLNGEWEFEIDCSNSGKERGYIDKEEYADKIIVPFCPESILSGVHHTDFMNAVWYRKKISLHKSNEENILLHFGAVDYYSEVYVNGSLAGKHRGGYASFTFDITEYAQDGDNTIVVYAYDDVRSGRQPRGKQSAEYHSHGCEYTRTTGIYETVWLEYVPKQYVQNVKYYPDITNGLIKIDGQVSQDGELSVVVSFDGKVCGEKKVKTSYGRFSTMIELDELHLWEPGEGNLYQVEFSFGKDRVSSYFGMRELKMDGYKFILNGKSVFQRLVLDQGFYPDGIYTAPSDEAMINDIQISMGLGFNGARLHERVFSQRFLYHCDRLGYMVWDEYGNWGMDISDISNLPALIEEWSEIVNRDFNSPAVIGWCPFNETWDYNGRRQDDRFLETIYHITKNLDNTRPCIDTSGNFHVITDIYDVHNYIQNVEEFASWYDPFGAGGEFRDEHSHRQHYKKGQPVFVSEYGGIKWDVESGNKAAWGYGQAPTTMEEFIARYDGLTTTLLKNPNIMGFCYTQLYDVEQETNGLYTYERKEKFDAEVIRRINTQKAAIEQ